METGLIKSRPDYHQTTRAIVQHEQRSRSDSRIKKTTHLSRGSGFREARLAHMALAPPCDGAKKRLMGLATRDMTMMMRMVMMRV